MHFDGSNGSTTFTDSSTGGVNSPHTFSAQGNAQISTAQSKFGGASGLMDGTGDYIQSVDSVDWLLGASGTGNFTIEFWVRFVVVSATGFAAQRDNGNDNWVLEMQTTTSIGIRTTEGGVGKLNANWSWTPSTATWYHVACIRGWGGNANDFMITIDGTALGAAVTNAYTFIDLAQTFTVCKDGTAAGTSLNGYMDEFRLSKVARWTANFTPSSVAYS